MTEPDDVDAGPITTDHHRRGVCLGFRDGTWDIVFPQGWQAVPSDEDDLWRWASGELQGRIRLRRHPRIQFEVHVTNNGTEVAQVESPVAVLSPSRAQVPWFAGAAGEALQTLPHATAVWVQHRGSCVATADGCSLFQDPVLLRPGQGISALWRRELVPPALLVPEPAWVPRQRYLRRGEVLEVEHTDAALTGDGVQILTTADGSQVTGDAGLHQLCFLDARGSALVEVGWFDPLEHLAASPAALGNTDPNVVAWLLACADAPVNLDDLDITLAEALERPTAWGVLAGMRAATTTDLPVAAEVRDAARVVWRTELDPVLRRFMITHGVLCGWERDIMDQWCAAGAAVVDEVADLSPQEMLETIGFGRITSSSIAHGGRSVAMAGMWLVGREESVLAAEWEHAVDVARRRLMCQLSSAPEADDIAWLLAYSLLSHS